MFSAAAFAYATPLPFVVLVGGGRAKSDSGFPLVGAAVAAVWRNAAARQAERHRVLNVIVVVPLAVVFRAAAADGHKDYVGVMVARRLVERRRAAVADLVRRLWRKRHAVLLRAVRVVARRHVAAVTALVLRRPVFVAL